MGVKTKQQIESLISQAMKDFLKEQMAEEVEQVCAEVIEDAIIVRFKGVLPPAERLLVKDQRGLELIKELKEKLIEKVKPFLEEMIKNLIEAEVLDIHSSFNPATGERIVIFTLDKKIS